jgi:hypothetical protein
MAWIHLLITMSLFAVVAVQWHRHRHYCILAARDGETYRKLLAQRDARIAQLKEGYENTANDLIIRLSEMKKL